MSCCNGGVPTYIQIWRNAYVPPFKKEGRMEEPFGHLLYRVRCCRSPSLAVINIHFGQKREPSCTCRVIFNSVFPLVCALVKNGRNIPSFRCTAHILLLLHINARCDAYNQLSLLLMRNTRKAPFPLHPSIWLSPPSSWSPGGDGRK